MNRTITIIALLATALAWAAPSASSQDEQAAWGALDDIMPNNTYPPRGRLVRAQAPPADELLARLDAALPKTKGTSAEPFNLFHKASALWKLERFDEALKVLRDVKARFPEHLLCTGRMDAKEGSQSLVDDAIADCESEIAIRKVYTVTELPHAVLSDKATAVIHTTQGDVAVQFYKDVAPKAVENFKKLALEGFYNDTYFHHVVNFHRIEGGCPNTRTNRNRDDDGQGSPGYTLPLELSDALHKSGTISMVGNADGSVHGSQFTICVNDQPALNNKQTVFGMVTTGMDVVRRISQSRADDKNNPYDSVKITSVEWIETE